MGGEAWEDIPARRDRKTSAWPQAQGHCAEFGSRDLKELYRHNP